MMLQTGGPPDTTTYYHIAYAWVGLAYAGYAALLWSRARRIRALLRGARDRDTRATRGT
jgi:hypothetical protein